MPCPTSTTRGAATDASASRPARKPQNLQTALRYIALQGARLKPGTLTQDARRLDPVLRWLASHPDADPDLYLLADLACLSPYHFHRVYRAMMGETVNATVQRIRMHRAAAALAGSQVSLREVAQRAGYESDAAFNRAFGAAFGIPPGRYSAARSRPFDPQELGMYPISIENFPGVILAAAAHRAAATWTSGPCSTASSCWRAAVTWPRARPAAMACISTIRNRCPSRTCARWPECRSRPTAVPGDGLERFEIPEACCAVLAYTGPYSEMGKAYNWMFSEWLPGSGMVPADFPMFEQYMNDPRSTPPAQLLTRIHLPLK